MSDLKIIFMVRKYTRRIINSGAKLSSRFLIDERIFQAAEIVRIYVKTA
ncbi:MAG: hypothetical protein NTV43_02570 [Methylococcales bacterium]|nr:hypothetical protein [Methylococcales bacterium]